MKIKYEYPRGYLSEMKNARANGDFDAWVNGKYGAFIRDQISNDFALDIQETFFVVDFTYEDDGIAFLRDIGGRAVNA